ncbi:unnamed protein product [Discula destructiva]
MPEHGTEMDLLHKMFGPDDHAPIKPKQDNGHKQVTLTDMVQEADVEKGDDSKMPESAVAVEAGGNANTQKDKKPGFFSKVGKVLKEEFYVKPVAFWGRSKNAVIITLLLACACLVAVVISLSIVTVNGSKHAAQIQGVGVAARALLGVNAGPILLAASYRELRNDLLSLTTDNLDTLLAVTQTSVTSDVCDNETPAVSAAIEPLVLSPVATMASFNPNVTTATATLMGGTSTIPISINVLTEPHPAVTPFLTTSTMVAEVTASISSSSSSSSSVIETCGEWGDGAGPCARPYGHPNNTPETWLSAMVAQSLDEPSTVVPAIVSAGISTTQFPVGIPAMVSPVASSVSDLSLSSLVGASILDASECAPTTTVYVTITASEPSDLTGTGDGATIYVSSTSTLQEVLTLSWSGPGGPLTTTETAFLGNNNNNNGTAGTGPLSTQNFTLTLQTTVAPNGTTFSSSSPSPSPSSIASTSGSEQLTAPKPLGMGGNASGNGVYCVVMLVALVALFI